MTIAKCSGAKQSNLDLECSMGWRGTSRVANMPNMHGIICLCVCVRLPQLIDIVRYLSVEGFFGVWTLTDFIKPRYWKLKCSTSLVQAAGIEYWNSACTQSTSIHINPHQSTQKVGCFGHAVLVFTKVVRLRSPRGAQVLNPAPAWLNMLNMLTLSRLSVSPRFTFSILGTQFIAEEVAVRPNSPLQARLKCFGNSCASDSDRIRSAAEEKVGKSSRVSHSLCSPVDFGKTLARSKAFLPKISWVRWTNSHGSILWLSKSIREFEKCLKIEQGVESEILDVILYKSSLPHESTTFLDRTCHIIFFAEKLLRCRNWTSHLHSHDGA